MGRISICQRCVVPSHRLRNCHVDKFTCGYQYFHLATGEDADINSVPRSVILMRRGASVMDSKLKSADVQTFAKPAVWRSVDSTWLEPRRTLFRFRSCHSDSFIKHDCQHNIMYSTSQRIKLSLHMFLFFVCLSRVFFCCLCFYQS